jgi:hypothetical protein
LFCEVDKLPVSQQIRKIYGVKLLSFVLKWC